MNETKRRFSGYIVSALGGAFLAWVCLSMANGCSGRKNVLAYVNGQPISMKEFYEYLPNKKTVTVQAGAKAVSLPVAVSFGYQGALDLVDEELELQLAKSKGLEPSESDVEHEIKFRLRQNPSFLVDLEAEGVTTDVIKKDIQVDLSVERLLTQGVTVTREQALNYFKTHPREFQSPPAIQLSLIFAKDKAGIAQADRELETGQSFAETAVQYSQATTARSYHGTFTDPDKPAPTLDSLPLEVQRALVGLKEKDSTKWIAFDKGYAKFHIDKLFLSRPVKLDEDGIETLRRNLAKMKGGQKHNIATMIRSQMSDKRIEFVPENYQDFWESERSSAGQ